MTRRLFIAASILTGVAACGPGYSPDTDAGNAAQQANKVEPGLIVGVRTVSVSAAGAIGTVTGAAAGGITGSQLAYRPINAFTTLGGSPVGGIAGSAVAHASADTVAFEYIVRKPNGDLVSVTQNDRTPLVLGQKVLVIADNQARVVPDYTLPPVKTAETPRASAPAKAGATPLKANPVEAESAEAKTTDPKSVDPKPVDAKRADTP